MKKTNLTQRHQTEKAIINALLKISEIIQKTELNRKHQQLIDSNEYSKQTIGNGDYNELYNNEQQVPTPPPMRTLDSYVSGFNQQSLQTSLNCNQISIHKSKQYDQSSEKNSQNNNIYKHVECSYKRHYYDSSSISSSSASSSNDHHHRRKKSLKHHSSKKSLQINKNSQPLCQQSDKTENQPTITTFKSQTTSYQINSAATTILDDQSSSLIMMPIASAPTISPLSIVEQQPLTNPTFLHIEQQQQPSSPSTILTESKTDFDIFIDQQLQATLEKRLKDHSLPSTNLNNKNIQQLRKTRLATLTKSETEKLTNNLNFTKEVYNLEYYEKQRELAMLAAKQGNYTLSYTIYTNLLHNNQYDYKLKSEILASRATTLLLEENYFQSIDDCTQAIAFNQWNKLAYVVRAACWMIKQEYSKAVEDYSKLFHFFDQSQHVLDLLNLAYEKLQLTNNNEQLIKIEQDKENKTENNLTQPMTSSIGTSANLAQSLSLTSPTASFIQPAIYLCYPYQAYPSWYNTNNEQQQQQQPINTDGIQQSTYIIKNSNLINPSEKLYKNISKTKYSSLQSILSNINPIISTNDSITPIEHKSSSINKNSY